MDCNHILTFSSEKRPSEEDHVRETTILIGNSYSIFISQLNSLRVIDLKWRKVVEAEYFA
jgi:hypothetical protein